MTAGRAAGGRGTCPVPRPRLLPLVHPQSATASRALSLWGCWAPGSPIPARLHPPSVRPRIRADDAALAANHLCSEASCVIDLTERPPVLCSDEGGG